MLALVIVPIVGSAEQDIQNETSSKRCVSRVHLRPKSDKRTLNPKPLKDLGIRVQRAAIQFQGFRTASEFPVDTCQGLPLRLRGVLLLHTVC